MKRQWRVRREVMERPDARRRWDRAYQSILRWSLETDQHSDPSVNGKEGYHEGSAIRPGLDLSAGQTPDYPKQQLEMVQKHTQELGWYLPQENIFRDDGYSGTTLKRPALDALRDKARLRELEVVVVLSAPIACSLISRPTSSQRSEMGYSLRLLAPSPWGYLSAVRPLQECFLVRMRRHSL